MFQMNDRNIESLISNLYFIKTDYHLIKIDLKVNCGTDWFV